MTLRVLLYTSTARNRAGGVQTVYRRLVDGLTARGHVVRPVWAEPGLDERSDVGVLRLALPRPGAGPYRAARSVAATVRSAASLVAELARFRPDIVNVHFARPELAHFVALRPVFRYRLVVSVHGSDLLKVTPDDRDRVGRLLSRADAVTAVSRELADLVLALPGVDPDAVSVVPNGIDTEFWSVPRHDRSRGGPPTVLTVGRLTPDHKGQDVLLRAFVDVRRRCQDARLVLVGSGAWRGELEELAEHLQLGPAVRFVGELPPMGVRDLMAQAQVFTLASRREGLPMALLEAMSTGLPAVVTDVGSMAEVVVPGTGRVVPPDDAGALAEALVALLKDGHAAREAGERARARAHGFAASAVDEAYERLFERLATRHTR